MTTIINTPAAQPVAESGGGAMPIVIGSIVLVGFAMVLFYVGIPALRRMNSTQMNLPATQVVIPGKIDVNVSQTK